MNAVDFNKLIEDSCDQIKKVLVSKNTEYASKDDVFHNFSTAGQRRGISKERALDGMMLKHEVSVGDLIRWAEQSPERLTRELIDEKIGDNINYLLLLKGMLYEHVVPGLKPK